MNQLSRDGGRAEQASPSIRGFQVNYEHLDEPDKQRQQSSDTLFTQNKRQQARTVDVVLID